MNWESWFAWHPVVVDGKWVWWTTIERRIIYYGIEVFVFYRFIGNGEN